MHKFVFCFFLFFSLSPLTIKGFALSNDVKNEDLTKLYFQTIQNDPNELRIFLQEMPKGGDLHNHLGGASYPEFMMNYAEDNHYCINTKSNDVVFYSIHCPNEDQISMIKDNSVIYNKVIDAWSMRHYNFSSDLGETYFFSLFPKTEALSKYRGQMLTEVINRAANEHIDYLELMIAPDDINKIFSIADKIPWDNNFAQMTQKLQQKGINSIVSDIGEKLVGYEDYYRSQFHCGQSLQSKACKVEARYQISVLRDVSPVRVFTQLLVAFDAANKNSKIVAVNLVQEESSLISIRDYDLHMQMIAYFRHLYPHVKVSLHAGEMAFGQVPPEYLQDHIDKAVNIAGADRIGHGVDISYEKNARELLDKMAKNQILVEVCLTSNADILGVEGQHHPIMLYIHHSVPIALSTDDEGVFRTDLTNEYQRAAETYYFNYVTLKAFSRNGLTYSFLPGKSLWEDNRLFTLVSSCRHDILGSITPSLMCQNYLKSSKKAQLQWRLEGEFQDFEKTYARLYLHNNIGRQ